MFTVNFGSRTPVYQQLYDDVVRLTSLGILKSHTKLPPVRTLATELGINPNTVQKAYRILEQEKVIVTVRGKGAYIASKKPEIPIEDKISDVKRQIRPLLMELLYMGIGVEKIHEMIAELCEEMKEEEA